MNSDQQRQHQIEITNSQTGIQIDEQSLLVVAKQALSHLQISTSEISIVLVDNKTIHEINNQFLQHDFPTDVITFPMNDPASQPLEGEIMISAEMASEFANSVGWQPQEEISLYLIHGILHLCGYDDLNEHDQQIMRQKEHQLLLATNIAPQSNDTRWQNLD